ncbi:hypothetical protein [Salipiger abyssi]|uniref:hypothetical protein n=1 Tax=Salipiger abyssi TaxID=1250539 RepID=UPI0040591007
MTQIIFICRRSPDWASLSRDYQQGLKIDDSRYVPQEHIPGFPKDLPRLIARWNKSKKVDFFTFRATVAEISQQSIRSVPSSISLEANDPRLAEIVAGHPDALIYFHDDDDFFSPDIAKDAEAAAEKGGAFDVLVSPLPRIGLPTYTFVTPEMEPEFVWGAPTPFHFRFQSNNYGLRLGGGIPAEDLLKYADHVEASAFADETKPVIRYSSKILSATIKTPASASLLQFFFGRRARLLSLLGRRTWRDSYFQDFVKACDTSALPADLDWLRRDSDKVIALVDKAGG